MNKSSKILNMVLPLLLLMMAESSSFAQGSVRDTTFTLYSMRYCEGSVHDTLSLCEYVAVAKTYTSYTSTSKRITNVKTDVSYYWVSCPYCDVLRWRHPGGMEISLPESSRVKDRTLLSKLNSLLASKYPRHAKAITPSKMTK